MPSQRTNIPSTQKEKEVSYAQLSTNTTTKKSLPSKPLTWYKIVIQEKEEEKKQKSALS